MNESLSAEPSRPSNKKVTTDPPKDKDPTLVAILAGRSGHRAWDGAKVDFELAIKKAQKNPLIAPKLLEPLENAFKKGSKDLLTFF